MDRFRNILLYLQAEESDSAALERAVELCRRSGAKLELLAVTPELSVYLRYPQFSYPSLEETLRQEAERRLEKLAARARTAGVDVRARVRHGKPSLEITREVIAERNDLVMVDAGDHEVMRLFQLCSAPVWAVRPGHAGAYGRILAAVDPSSQRESERGLDQQILNLAVGLAEVENAQLDVIHAWTAGPEWGPEAVEVSQKVQDLARQSFEKLLEPFSLPKESAHLVEGDPAQAITAFVEDNEIDLLVMGTIVRTGVAGFLMGNTAEKVLGRVDCSVLALKPAGFRSPVDAARPQHRARLPGTRSRPTRLCGRWQATPPAASLEKKRPAASPSTVPTPSRSRTAAASRLSSSHNCAKPWSCCSSLPRGSASPWETAKTPSPFSRSSH